MVKKFWIALCAALSLSMFAGLANASCTLSGVIVRVTSYDDSSANASFIYFRPSSLAAYYYYVSTTDDDMISNAIAHMNSGRTVTIQGNVASCPAVPAAGGAASLGALTYIYNP